MMTEDAKETSGCRGLWFRCVQFVRRLVCAPDVNLNRSSLEGPLCRLVGKSIPRIYLTNGVILHDYRLVGYDGDAIFVCKHEGTVAVLRHAIACISYSMEDTLVVVQEDTGAYSLQEFLESLKKHTVEYTTVLSDKPDHLVLSKFQWDSVELTTADDSTVRKGPKLIPLSALCSIGAGSPPPAK